MYCVNLSTYLFDCDESLVYSLDACNTPNSLKRLVVMLLCTLTNSGAPTLLEVLRRLATLTRRFKSSSYDDYRCLTFKVSRPTSVCFLMVSVDWLAPHVVLNHTNEHFAKFTLEKFLQILNLKTHVRNTWNFAEYIKPLRFPPKPLTITYYSSSLYKVISSFNLNVYLVHKCSAAPSSVYK